MRQLLNNNLYTAGTYHKANMEDQLRAGLAVQGTEASQIMNPPPLERQRSKSVPPPSTNLNPFYDHKMIHPTTSSDTIDSNSRPTSVTMDSWISREISWEWNHPFD
jgi:hypothetical protein